MRKIILMSLALSFAAKGDVIPSYIYPKNINKVKPAVFSLDMATPYVRQSQDCDKVIFNEYYFLSKINADDGMPKNFPITDWQCVYLDGEKGSYGLDYDPDVADEKPANEVVVYDEKNDVWKIKKRKHQYYKDAVPLTLYNITSPNSKGYMVIDENINKYDLQKGIAKKKEVAFCMIQKTTLVALCGQGNLLKVVDGKEVDFTPYILKSLESMTLSNPTDGK
ncbi:hypothetical protein ACEV60_10480 [Enterobacter ludwigii]|uniref:hypothetical protein n=1 Tax=Enterobacter ludwigii TaxID=299767 RepID=UPI003BEF48CF